MVLLGSSDGDGEFQSVVLGNELDVVDVHFPTGIRRSASTRSSRQSADRGPDRDSAAGRLWSVKRQIRLRVCRRSDRNLDIRWCMWSPCRSAELMSNPLWAQALGAASPGVEIDIDLVQTDPRHGRW